MTNGPKIRIDADISGISASLQKLRSQVEESTKGLNKKTSIDLSATKQSLGEINKAVSEVQNSLKDAFGKGAKLDGIDKLALEFDDALKPAEELKQVIEAIGGGTSITKAINDTRNLIREAEKAQKLVSALRKDGINISPADAGKYEKELQRRIELGGRGTRKLKKFGGLADIADNWRDLSPLSEIDSRREYRQLLQSIGIKGGHGGGGGGGEEDPKRRGIGQFVRDLAVRGGRSIIHSAAPNMGGSSSIFKESISEAGAAEGGMLSSAGIGRMAAGGAIGLLAFGAMKAFGAVKAKVGAVENEGVGYADLQRQIGAAASDFDDFRAAIRAATGGLGVAYADMQKYASRYTSSAGIDASQGMSNQALRSELITATGFSRSFGMDPSSGVDLFSTLRKNHVTNNDSENKRFALMIGDAIGRTHAFSKADDVLSAITSFTAQATRATLSPANTEGFIGGMAGLMNSAPGLDPTAAAGLLGKMDSSIRGGGSDAQKAMLLGIMQRNVPGMNAYDMGILTDGGAFGSAERMFGKDSQAYRTAKTWAEKTGDKSPMLRYEGIAKQGGPRITIDQIMNEVMKSGNFDVARESLKSYGYSDSDALALIDAKLKNGSIQGATNGLSKYGIDPSKMNTTSVTGMITAEYGSHDDRMKQVKYLRTQKLTAQETAMLEKAVSAPGKDDADLKAALVKLSSTHEMEQNEGDATRKSMAAIDNSTAQLATQLIPLTNAVREAVVAVAEKLTFGAFKDRYGNTEKKNAAMEDELANAKTSADRQRIFSKYLKEVNADPKSYTKEFRDKLDMQLFKTVDPSSEAGKGDALATASPLNYKDQMAVNDAAKKVKAKSEYDELFQKYGAKYGIDPDLLKTVAVKESGLRPGAINQNKNGTVDRGLMQLNSRYDNERGVADPFDPEQNIAAGAAVLARSLKASNGNIREGLRRYNGTGSQAEAYADKTLAIYNKTRGDEYVDTSAMLAAKAGPHTEANFGQAFAQQSPLAFKTAVTSPATQTFNHFIQLRDQHNRDIADPLFFTHLGQPKPIGS